MNTKRPSSASVLPKWLQKLQQESWQAEILLSGLVLYSLLKVPEGIRQLHDWMHNAVYYHDGVRVMSILLTLASYWLITGFIVHLVLRGVWVGYIGISYVFPETLNLSRLHLPQRYRLHLQDVKLPEHQIVKLENICSTLFGLSFYFFMCLLGAALYLILTISLQALLYPLSLDTAGRFLIRLPYYLLIAGGVLYFIDFLSLGWLKRAKWISALYYPIYRVVSLLTLAPLYRTVYYVLLVRFKRRVLLLFLLLYTIITFVVYVLEEQRYFDLHPSRLALFPHSQTKSAPVMDANSYAASMQDPFKVNAYIQSEVVRDGLLRLVVVHAYSHDKRALENCKTLYPNGPESGKEKLDCLSNYYHITINQTTLSSPDWTFYRDNQSRKKSLLAYLSVDSLPSGKHVLQVIAGDLPYATIPFFVYPSQP